MSASTGPVIPANAILAAIDRATPGMLREQCVEVELRRGQVLAEPGQPIGSIYFPHDAVISLTVSMAAGAMAEAATVGREGMTGYSAAFGERAAFARSVVQVAGSADRLPLDAFTAAFAADRRVRSACATPRRCSARSCSRSPAARCTRPSSASPAGC